MKTITILFLLGISFLTFSQAVYVTDSIDIGSLTDKAGYDTAIVIDRMPDLYGNFFIQFDYSDLTGDDDSLMIGESAFNYAGDIYASLNGTALPFVMDVTTNERVSNSENGAGNSYATVSFKIEAWDSKSRYFWIYIEKGSSTTGDYLKYRILK